MGVTFFFAHKTVFSLCFKTFIFGKNKEGLVNTKPLANKQNQLKTKIYYDMVIFN